MRHRRTSTLERPATDPPKAARPDVVSARTVGTDRSSGVRMSSAEAAAWVEAGKEITPAKVLERLARHQQFVIGNVTVLGTLLAALGCIGAILAIAHEDTFSGDASVVAIGALATTAVAGVAVLAALVARRVRSQSIDVKGAMNARAYYTNEAAVRGWVLRLATTLLLLAVALALATGITAGVLALAGPEEPSDGPQNRAALSATAGGDGSVTVYLTGAVEDLADGEYLAIEVTSAGQTIIAGNVHPDGGGTAELASEAQVPAGSDEALAVITVLRPADGGDEVVGSPFILDARYTAPSKS